MSRISAVCVVHTLLPEFSNPDKLTAIDKRAVSFAVPVGPYGLGGDLVKDIRHHGGLDQAVYAYADEDAAWWASELGREITPGLFGENLRTTGVDVTGAEIGERWRIGDGGLVVEVTDPRTPCGTFQRRMGEENWIRRFTEHGAPGAYLRVVSEGPVTAGDALEIVHRPGSGITIGTVFARD
jgi:MOSC domain-containing protein YiiM